MLVAVHGATGAQGRPVIDRLLEAGHRPRAIARTVTPSAVREGVEHASADVSDVDALLKAYTGVDAAVIVLPGGAPDDVAVRQANAILEALRRAGVPRAVFNAGGGIWTRPPAIPFLQARSQLVAGLPDAVGVATVVAPAGGLMENFNETWILERLRRTGELVQSMPADARTRPVAMADIAAVIVDSLTEDAPPARILVQAPPSTPAPRSQRRSQRTPGGRRPGPPSRPRNTCAVSPRDSASSTRPTSARSTGATSTSSHRTRRPLGPVSSPAPQGSPTGWLLSTGTNTNNDRGVVNMSEQRSGLRRRGALAALAASVIVAVAGATVATQPAAAAPQAAPRHDHRIEHNKQVVARFYAAFNAADLAELDRVLHPAWVNDPTAAGQAPGREGFKQVVTAFHAGFSNLRLVNEDVVAEGDRVAVRSTVYGTHTGTFFGVAATARASHSVRSTSTACAATESCTPGTSKTSPA
jgi:uncharacterized protein YbjT (DUF2867 family)/predicted ester cyclase